MQFDYIRPNIYAMLPERLADFVHNKAQDGDIATTYDLATNRRFFYFCTEKNIGKDIENPCWMMINEKVLFKSMFENMTLEEKVDFLIDKYIEQYKTNRI